MIDNIAKQIADARKTHDERSLATPYAAVASLLKSDGIVIDAQSMLDYLSEKTGMDDDLLWPYVRDHIFINTPPSDDCWVEWRFSGWRFAGLCEFRCASDIEKESTQNTIIDLPSYTLDMGFFSAGQYDSGGGYFPFRASVFLRDDGTIILTRDGNFGMIGIESQGEEYDIAKHDRETYQRVYTMAAELVSIVLFTFSMLNVKNVVRVEHKADRKLQERRKKRGQLPLVKYYTLEVEVPGKRAIGSSPANASETSSRPLHLVRGHLADYRDGKGLFGKHKGVYYIPSHMRGDIDNGVIKKRYRVTTDKD